VSKIQQKSSAFANAAFPDLINKILGYDSFLQVMASCFNHAANKIVKSMSVNHHLLGFFVLFSQFSFDINRSIRCIQWFKNKIKLPF